MRFIPCTVLQEIAEGLFEFQPHTVRIAEGLFKKISTYFEQYKPTRPIENTWAMNSL